MVTINVGVIDVLYLCNRSRRGFLSITTSQEIDGHELIEVIETVRITVTQERKSFPMGLSLVRNIDKVQYALSAQILHDKHKRDRLLDEPVDFSTQYVRLKLQSDATIGAMKREEVERPDYYQDSLKEQGGTDIEEEELVKGYDSEKYILLRGRAGIGKSTLLQRLVWKWANGEWANQFKAIFLFNLRYLVTITQAVDIPVLLNTYSVYPMGRSDLMVDKDWLEDNEADIAFVLDGVDEVRGFKELWMHTEQLTTTSKPISWCFGLMKKQLFSNSTVLVSSRPFADLGYISRTVKEKSLSTTLLLVQLLGLTRERVHEFIDKHVQEGSRDFVRKTLEKNPILMSISSITFYCAALCKILGEKKEAPTMLKTYSQITAYIMDRFIQRSLQKFEETFNVNEVLQFLTKLAFNGLMRELGHGPVRLMFDATDFKELTMTKDLTSTMIKSGLLVQTEILDPDDGEKCTVLSQFVHLMIQELLAMVGLLSQTPEQFKKQLDILSNTQQFSMAILFLYGLAFNRNNEILRRVDISDPMDKLIQQKQDALTDFAKNMPNTLQALQVAHESQSPDVAKAIGETTFKDGCNIENTKLTVIDVMALEFVLRHNTACRALKLEQTELDEISIKEFVKILLEVNHIEKLCLVDNTLNDACIGDLMAALSSSTIQTLELSSNRLTDRGMANVAQALGANKSLKTLYISSSAVKDEGMKEVAGSLQTNGTLQSLRFMFGGMTDVGLQYLLDSLLQNDTLEELCMIGLDITDKGLAALGQVLLIKPSIRHLRVDCGAMSDEGVQHIADALTTNGLLETLWLHSGKITDKGVEYLMHTVKGQKALMEITLLGFYMKKDGAQAILDALSVVQNVKIRIKTPEVTSPLLDQINDHTQIELL